MTALAILASIPPRAWAQQAAAGWTSGPATYRWFGGHIAHSIGLEVIAILLCMYILYRGSASLLRAMRGALRCGGERGAVVLQFVLLLPLLLCVMLTTFQLALVVHAKFVVNYAAFCAVRSAIVIVPTAIVSRPTGKRERANVVNFKDPDSPKLHIVRRAAALACVGISPPWSLKTWIDTGTPLNWTGFAPLTTMSAVFDTYTPKIDPGLEFMKRQSYAFSADNTKIKLQIEPYRQNPKNGPSYSLITAEVTYRYYLTVPFGNLLLGKRYIDFGFFNRFIPGTYYIAIRERYTLPSEDDPLWPNKERPIQDMWTVELYE
jgi:hypothetical protein